MDYDPYTFADDLNDMAEDLVSDVTSLTVHDIAVTLRTAADFILKLADDHNSYVARTKATLTIGHETIDLTDEIIPAINSMLVRQWVREAFHNQLSAHEKGYR
jgi:hypothetical protein